METKTANSPLASQFTLAMKMEEGKWMKEGLIIMLEPWAH